jgi:hypothetical protein
VQKDLVLLQKEMSFLERQELMCHNTGTPEAHKEIVKKSVVDCSVGHGGPQFKSRRGHLFISLLICDLIDC